jgi:succinate-semialdehyde dehydrogenase/glutarate-semialdehyde dehydrogenase
VILKPSEVTPLTSLLMTEMVAECGMPKNVFQVATGRGETGSALVDEVDMVMFTGSVATGKTVMARAAETLTPVSLELGGNDPMVVLADADLERATNAAISYGLNNSGQVCISIERIYVEKDIADEFTQKFGDAVRNMKLGTAYDFTVDMGSMISEDQVKTVSSHVDDATAKGAKVIAGGQARPDIGPLFYEPTVLTDVTPENDVYREELFGPVAQVYRVSSEEEAVALANDTPFGLGSYVMTNDPEQAERVADAIDAGMVYVNIVGADSAELPFGGTKRSGFGRELGRYGADEFVNKKLIRIS